MGFTRISGKLSIVIPIILILFISSYIYPNTQAQSNTFFSPKDQFLIPSYNGAINFATNGSYYSATFENNSWTFENLSINGPLPLQSFLVSTQNSNVTIFSYSSFGDTPQIQILNYAVVGNGKQTFNFGQQGHVQNVVDWTVIKTIDRKNVFLTPGKDWTFSPNGTIVVNGATGNFTIFYFPAFDGNLLNSNLPFYQQHSVAIVTLTAVAIVIVLAVVFALRNRKYLIEKKLGDGSLTQNSDGSTLKDKEKT